MNKPEQRVSSEELASQCLADEPSIQNLALDLRDLRKYALELEEAHKLERFKRDAAEADTLRWGRQAQDNGERLNNLRDAVTNLRRAHDEDVVLVPVFMAMLERLYILTGNPPTEAPK